MNQRLRVTSSVLASSFALLALAGLHGACSGVVLTADGSDANADGTTGTKPDSSAADAHSNPDSQLSRDGGATDSEAIDCSTMAGKLARWSVMDRTPFAPWNMAGLDIGSGDAGIGLIEAENINCPGTPVPTQGFPMNTLPPYGLVDGGNCDVCGHCYAAIAWGASHEVDFEYDTATEVVSVVLLNAGYTGAADFWSDPKSKLDPPGTGGGSPSVGPGQTMPSNHYRVVIGQEIQKNGQPFELNWDDPKMSSHQMIYNAMMYFYGSPLGLYFGKDYQLCDYDGSCLFFPPDAASYNDDLCIFGIRPLHFFLETDCATDLQPEVSTVVQIYERGEAYDHGLGTRREDGGALMFDSGDFGYVCDATVP